MSRAHRILDAGLLYAALALLGFGFPDDQPLGLIDLMYWAIIALLLATQPQGEEKA